MTFRNPQLAFNQAIEDGLFSTNPQKENYVGKFMYMGTNEVGVDLFKNIATRKYAYDKKSVKEALTF